MTSSMRI